MTAISYRDLLGIEFPAPLAQFLVQPLGQELLQLGGKHWLVAFERDTTGFYACTCGHDSVTSGLTAHMFMLPCGSGNKMPVRGGVTGHSNN